MLAICMGMRRSASTLQYNAVSEIVERTGSGRREGFYELREYDAFKSDLKRWARDDLYHVIKTHEWLPLNDLAHNSRRYFYVWREYLDVANSMRKKSGTSLTDIITAIRHDLEIKRFLESTENALIQRYGDLINDDTVWLKDIATHLDLTVDFSLFSEVARVLQISETERQVDTVKRSPKKKVLRTLQNSGLRRELGRILRVLGVNGRTYYVLRRLTAPYDARTLYHSNHVAPNQSSMLSREEEVALVSIFGRQPADAEE